MEFLRTALYKVKRTLVRLTKKMSPRQLYFLFLRIKDSIYGTDFYSYSEQESPEALGMDLSTVFRSTPSGFWQLGKVIKENKWIDRTKVLDIGCGKGSAMKIFHEYGFERVAGIEINNYIYNICQKNFDKLGRSVDLFNLNALDFNQYSEFSTFYMYNPFPCEVFEMVLKKILHGNKHSKITLIYSNNKCHELLINSNFIVMDERTDIWGNNIVVYCIDLKNL